MDHLPVHWYEGMFISPHHFQASDRYWAGMVSTGLAWNYPYGYGLHKCEINTDSLSNNLVQIDLLQARFRDGTIVNYGAEQRLDPISLEGAFGDSDTLYVFLCTQRLELSKPAVGDPKVARYSVKSLPAEDENTGADPMAIDLRQTNCFLEVRSVDRKTVTSPAQVAPPGVESLPILRVRKARKDESFPEIDDAYFPPMISTNAWPALATGVLNKVFSIVGRNVDLLGSRVASRELTFSSARAEGDLDDLLKLSVLNRAYATMKNWGVQRPSHPFDAFLALCGLYGDLAVFDNRSPGVASDVPSYDHDNLQPIFEWLRIRIEKLVQTAHFEWEYADFTGSGDSMSAALKPYWLHKDWTWYIGIRSSGLPVEQAQDSIKRLNWKMASARQIDEIFKIKLRGVDFEGPIDPPRQLPNRQGWLFFQVQKTGEVWEDIEDHCTIAIKVDPERIANRSVWNGQTVMQLVDGGPALEFRLFAVPVG